MATKQQKPAPKKAEQKDEEFTLENRIAYFEWKLDYWQKKAEKFIAPKKVAHAKRRIENYTAKLAEATKLAAEKAAE